MPAEIRRTKRRMKPEQRNAVTGAFCLGWLQTSDRLAGACMGAGAAASHVLPTQLVNHIQSHAVGALSP